MHSTLALPIKVIVQSGVSFSNEVAVDLSDAGGGVKHASAKMIFNNSDILWRPVAASESFSGGENRQSPPEKKNPECPDYVELYLCFNVVSGCLTHGDYTCIDRNTLLIKRHAQRRKLLTNTFCFGGKALFNIYLLNCHLLLRGYKLCDWLFIFVFVYVSISFLCRDRAYLRMKEREVVETLMGSKLSRAFTAWKSKDASNAYVWLIEE